LTISFKESLSLPSH